MPSLIAAAARVIPRVTNDPGLRPPLVVVKDTRAREAAVPRAQLAHELLCGELSPRVVKDRENSPVVIVGFPRRRRLIGC